ALLHQPAEPLGGRVRLARAGSGRDEEGAVRPRVRGRGLLGAERGDERAAHSGGWPPYGQIAECGQFEYLLTHVPARSRGAGSNRPACMPAMAAITVERLRSRSSSVSRRSRYSFNPAGWPMLKMTSRIDPHTHSFGYHRERKRGLKPRGTP